jgi:transketolase C-terminal domain/subunit
MGSTRGWGEHVYDDLALLNTVHGCVVFVPCDRYSSKALIRLVLTSSPTPPANWRFFYIRTDDKSIEEEDFNDDNGTLEEKKGDFNQTQGRLEEDEKYSVYNKIKSSTGMSTLPPKFRIGGSNVLKKSFDDQLTLLCCGPTCVQNCLTAYEELLSKYGVVVRVVDLYCLKPVDKFTVLSCFTETRFLISVENHGTIGGLSSIVSNICPIECTLAANGNYSYSGTQEELERDNKHDVFSIVNAVVQVLSKEQGPEMLLSGDFQRDKF